MGTMDLTQSSLIAGLRGECIRDYEEYLSEISVHFEWIKNIIGNPGNFSGRAATATTLPETTSNVVIQISRSDVSPSKVKSLRSLASAVTPMKEFSYPQLHSEEALTFNNGTSFSKAKPKVSTRSSAAATTVTEERVALQQTFEELQTTDKGASFSKAMPKKSTRSSATKSTPVEQPVLQTSVVDDVEMQCVDDDIIDQHDTVVLEINSKTIGDAAKLLADVPDDAVVIAETPVDARSIPALTVITETPKSRKSDRRSRTSISKDTVVTATPDETKCEDVNMDQAETIVESEPIRRSSRLSAKTIQTQSNVHSFTKLLDQVPNIHHDQSVERDKRDVSSTNGQLSTTGHKSFNVTSAVDEFKKSLMYSPQTPEEPKLPMKTPLVLATPLSPSTNTNIGRPGWLTDLVQMKNEAMSIKPTNATQETFATNEKEKSNYDKLRQQGYRMEAAFLKREQMLRQRVEDQKKKREEQLLKVAESQSHLKKFRDSSLTTGHLKKKFKQYTRLTKGDANKRPNNLPTAAKLFNKMIESKQGVAVEQPSATKPKIVPVAVKTDDSKIPTPSTVIKEKPANASATVTSIPQNASSDLTRKNGQSPVRREIVDDYGINDLQSSDDTDDDEQPRKRIPCWAQGAMLKSAIIRQYYQPPDLHELFGIIQLPDLAIMFASNSERYDILNATSKWDSPIHPHCPIAVFK